MTPAPTYDPTKDKSKWCYGMSIEEYLKALKQGRGVPQIDIQLPDQKTGYINDPMSTNKTIDASKNTIRDPVKTSRLRRSRGYSFEYDLVMALKSRMGWNARRLGGSSTGLPDIVATHNGMGRLLVIECKSKDANSISIPDKQVHRLITTVELFGYYRRPWIVFAFKFKANDKDPLRQTLQHRYVAIYSGWYDKITNVSYSLKEDRCRYDCPVTRVQGGMTTLDGLLALVY